MTHTLFLKQHVIVELRWVSWFAFKTCFFCTYFLHTFWMVTKCNSSLLLSFIYFGLVESHRCQNNHTCSFLVIFMHVIRRKSSHIQYWSLRLFFFFPLRKMIFCFAKNTGSKCWNIQWCMSFKALNFLK